MSGQNAFWWVFRYECIHIWATKERRFFGKCIQLTMLLSLRSQIQPEFFEGSVIHIVSGTEFFYAFHGSQIGLCLPALPAINRGKCHVYFFGKRLLWQKATLSYPFQLCLKAHNCISFAHHLLQYSSIIAQQYEFFYCLRKISEGFFLFLSFKTVPRVRWVLEEKTSNPFGQNSGFCQGGIGGKKIWKSFVQKGPNCQGGTGEKKLQIFLARQPISLQWVVGEKSFRKSGPLHRFLSSGYWTKKFSKSFVQNR